MALFGRFRHIVVEGPIGAGKTTLVSKIAERYGLRPMLEQPDANPFLERFYRDSARFALPTQLFFLFQRVQQLGELKQLDLNQRAVIADFLLEKDPLFARLNLADDEMKLYEQMFALMLPPAAVPDLVVYLQASPDSLIERVARRGRAMESGISETYLHALSDAYTRFFHQYDAAPVLVVNTEHLNPIDRDADFDLLLQRIEHLRGRREHFNLAE